MKLYYSPGACSLSVNIALREAGLAFEPVLAPTKTHQLPDGTDFHTINPLGYVPVLELDDGTRLREAGVVLQYIADQAPLKKLAPANGTLPRYRVQEWLTFISSELHKSFSVLFNSAMPEEARKIYRQKIESRFKWVNAELTGKEFLGPDFSVADIYLYVVTRWAQPMKLDLSPYPNLAAHHQRIAARPSVQEALKAEQLTTT